MRHKIMTAFVCAIMTMSVIPVYADDAQTDQVSQVDMTTQEQATTASKTENKTTTKATSHKSSDKKRAAKNKTTKNKKSKKKEETKIVPMPTQIITKSPSKMIQERIHTRKKEIQKLKEQKKKLKGQIVLETKKTQALQEFYQKYTKNSKVEIALYGHEITPAIKISKKDEAMREDLYALADLFQDENLRKIASEYVFGINHPDFETLLDKNETFNLDQYLKGEKILSTKPIEQQIKKNKEKIKTLKKDILKENKTRYFNPNDVSQLSNITVDDAKQMLAGTALYDDAKAYVKAEEKYHVNAVFLMGIAAHESAWGTSRRAREDNNLTGYGVTSDHAKGINKSTKEAGLLATAETLHERYLTPGGSYYEGTSAAAVNKHYCVGGEWAAAVVNNAYRLMNKL